MTSATQDSVSSMMGSSPDTISRSTTFNLRMEQNWYSIVVTQND